MSEPRPGQHVCDRHGIIKPAQDGPVPYCAAGDGGRTCQRTALHATRTKTGGITYVQPHPPHCSGEGRHQFGPGRMLLSSAGCLCVSSGRHLTWTCGECSAVTTWPPHRES